MAKKKKTHDTQYSLRNDNTQVFDIQAKVTKHGKTGLAGAKVEGKISKAPDLDFTYLVEFKGDFAKTKRNFTPEMYLHTAISVMEAQIESKKYSDSHILIHRDSGLMDVSPLG